MIDAILKWDFSLTQILAVLGAAQCIYALVFIFSNAEKTSRIIIPSCFYLLLAFCFLVDFATPHYKYLSDYMESSALAFWGVLPAISYLLIIQIAQIRAFPRWPHFIALAGPVISFFGASIILHGLSAHNPDQSEILQLGQWQDILTIITGGITLLAVWLSRKQLDVNWQDKAFGRPRYWMIMCLILMNIALLGCSIFRISEHATLEEWRLMRMVIGLAFIYLVVTSLFRIYPLPIVVRRKNSRADTPANLSEDDTVLVEKIEKLLTYEKVYQEASYSRSNLAQELGISEATVSRVMNEYYRKSIPQLLNEYRVEEAKTLLLQTNAPIQLVATEAGFQSLATFNRVFKDVVGVSPSDFRDPQNVKLSN